MHVLRWLRGPAGAPQTSDSQPSGSGKGVPGGAASAAADFLRAERERKELARASEEIDKRCGCGNVGPSGLCRQDFSHE